MGCSSSKAKPPPAYLSQYSKYRLGSEGSDVEATGLGPGLRSVPPLRAGRDLRSGRRQHGRGGSAMEAGEGGVGDWMNAVDAGGQDPEDILFEVDPEPVKDVKGISNTSLGLVCGSFADKGLHRHWMEDRVSCAVSVKELLQEAWPDQPDLPDTAVFGVYDGHGGTRDEAGDDVSMFLAKSMAPAIVRAILDATVNPPPVALAPAASSAASSSFSSSSSSSSAATGGGGTTTTTTTTSTAAGSAGSGSDVPSTSSSADAADSPSITAGAGAAAGTGSSAGHGRSDSSSTGGGGRGGGEGGAGSCGGAVVTRRVSSSGLGTRSRAASLLAVAASQLSDEEDFIGSVSSSSSSYATSAGSGPPPAGSPDRNPAAAAAPTSSAITRSNSRGSAAIRTITSSSSLSEFDVRTISEDDVDAALESEEEEAAIARVKQKGTGRFARLPSLLLSLSGAPTVNFPRLLTGVFRGLDDKILSQAYLNSAGSTATVAFLYGNALVVANTGDSDAVLCRKGQAHLITHPHKCEDESEHQRITNAGGRVQYKNTKFRLEGMLEVSRTFGVPLLKNLTKALIPDPHVSVVELCEDDEFLVIGSDGLFEGFKRTRALVTRVKDSLRQTRNAVETCREIVLEVTRKPKCTDNVSMVLMMFNQHGVVTARAGACGGASTFASTAKPMLRAPVPTFSSAAEAVSHRPPLSRASPALGRDGQPIALSSGRPVPAVSSISTPSSTVSSAPSSASAAPGSSTTTATTTHSSPVSSVASHASVHGNEGAPAPIAVESMGAMPVAVG